MQPAAQWSEQIGQSFAADVRTPDAFKLREQFIRQIGASSLFARTRIPARAFDDNFVHIGSHNFVIDWVELVRKPGFAPGPSASRAETLLLHHNPDGASGRTRTECLRTATNTSLRNSSCGYRGTEAKSRPRQESHLRPPPS